MKRLRQPERRRGIDDGGTTRTAKCIIHEGDEDGVYYIHYGVITFKWQPTSDRRNCGVLLVKEGGSDCWLRHIYTTDTTTLESLVRDIKKQFDSGITYNPTEDRRED